MSILGYDPAALPHRPRADRGRRPRPAAAPRPGRLPLQPRDGRRRRHHGRLRRRPPVAPRTRPRSIDALDDELGGRRRRSFHPGVQYRHILVAPADWAEADCTPPHDLSDKPAVWPTGPAAPKLQALMDASRDDRRPASASPPTRCGCGARASSRRCRRSATSTGCDAGLVHRGRPRAGPRRAHRHRASSRSTGATGWFDTDYEGKRDAALRALADGADLFLIHVEATDEAGHAGNLDEKIKALENWDRRILADLVDGLDALGPWRMLLLPDHPTPVAAEDPHDRLGAVPACRLRGRRPRRHLHRAGHRATAAVPGHELMGRLVGAAASARSCPDASGPTLARPARTAAACQLKRVT